MKPFTIEIHGTSNLNLGAELMAIAIANELRATYKNVRIVVPPAFGDFEARAKYSFFTTNEFPRDYSIRGRLNSLRENIALNYVAPGILPSIGVINPSEIDAVLDASGYSFSDHWGPNSARNLLNKMNGKARRGKPLILLPQALGPFKNPDVAKSAIQLFERANLVIARDSESFRLVNELGVNTKLAQYPDFSVLVQPIHEEKSKHIGNSSYVAIVPNYRILDKTEDGDNYIHFLKHTISLLNKMKLNPVFVLHDSNEDHKIVKLLNADYNISIFHDQDPRIIKGVLSNANFVIGSRFHALVGALSSGVPCIGLGWAHKYPRLFADFNFSEFLINDLTNFEKIEELINVLKEPENRNNSSSELIKVTEKLKSQCNYMWKEISNVLSIYAPESSHIVTQ